MFYRVMAILNFKEKSKADDFFHFAEMHLKDTLTINPNSPLEETSIVQSHPCYHDEQNPPPCEVDKQAESL